jgi:DNA ligase-1
MLGMATRGGPSGRGGGGEIAAREPLRRLLDRLSYEPRRNAKLRLLSIISATRPDPERGWALAAMTDALMFKQAKPNVIRGLVEERVDPGAVRMSYHYVGDLAETVALIWPQNPPLPRSGERAGVRGGSVGREGPTLPSPLRGGVGGWGLVQEDLGAHPHQPPPGGCAPPSPHGGG